MAAPLKDRFNADVVRAIAATLPVGEERFVADSLRGFKQLGLMDRARHVAAVMRDHLDPDPATAIGQLTFEPNNGFFFYNPHAFFIQEYGLGAYDESMAAMYQLTQVFTAEVCIRPFISAYPQAMRDLQVWAHDPSEHVRRLVSEGTRPRLPWAPQLPQFRADPEPVIRLLELLKDDPSDYVVRSVGNSLNDISKDHSGRVLEVASEWAPRPVIRRGLRTLIKNGDPTALRILGFTDHTATARAWLPAELAIGDTLPLVVDVEATTPVMVDIVVEFVRPQGVHRKVFKGAELAASGAVRATISFAQLSTRRVYPGPHRISALLNGRSVELGTVSVVGDSGPNLPHNR